MKMQHPVMWAYFGVLLVGLVGAVLTYRVTYSVCQVCGLQKYERAIYGIVLQSASSATVDPDGRAAQWKLAHNRECVHEWVSQAHSLLSPRTPFVPVPLIPSSATPLAGLAQVPPASVAPASSTPAPAN